MTTAQLTEAATSKTVQAGKYRVHYNEAGTGHPVIFLRGGGLGATGWSNFVRNIGPVSEHFRVLLVDQVGYGKTDDEVFTDEPSSTARARAVKDTMDALGIEKATLVGNSLGGSTSLTFAVDYPDRIEKMVLMGSGAGGVNLFAHWPTEGAKVLLAMFSEPTEQGPAGPLQGDALRFLLCHRRGDSAALRGYHGQSRTPGGVTEVQECPPRPDAGPPERQDVHADHPRTRRPSRAAGGEPTAALGAGELPAGSA